jgi:outer membrane usher protein
MARRPRKTCRWPIALAEIALLQALCMQTGFAADATADAAASSGPALLDDAGAYNSATYGGEDLYLMVTLNGTAKGLVHFGYRNDELWASVATLRQLGFRLPDATSDPVRLRDLGVKIAYDPSQQTVDMVAPLSLLDLATTVVDTTREQQPPATSSPGMLLNYNVYGTAGRHGDDSVNAFTELRAFGGSGVLSTTGLSRIARDSQNGWNSRSVRLDTAWSRSFQDDMVTLRVGDTLTGYLPWSRATRIGGVQVSRNFALQPYRITAPLPQFLGSAALPSDVELYVNGVRQYSGKVPAGPFQLNTAPTINGAGSAQVVLTDALGRATTLDFSMYAVHDLLQAGLSDWSAELGMVREDYGLRSFAYGSDPAASGTWRYGVSDQFTAEGHAEAVNGLFNGGAGGNWLLGSAGILSGALAHSQHANQSGSQWNLGYSWRGNRFNFSVDTTRSSGGYRDIASLYGAPNPRLSAQALIGATLGTAGSFGLSYLHLRYPGQPAARYASAYWFRSLQGRASLSLNLNQNLDLRSDRSIFFGFSLNLDSYTSVGSSFQRNGDRNTVGVGAHHSIVGERGFGWDTQLRQSGGLRDGQAELDYRGNYADMRAGVFDGAGQSYAYANADGAVVFMGGHPFASRRIDDGFAVVSTDGVADVPVRLENRLLGKTDRHGLMLVTPLNAYQGNLLEIDPMQLPADLRIDHVKAIATPSDRAGTLVRFPIRPIQAATVILQDEQGRPLPLGSAVQVDGMSDTGAMVGFDGEVYLDNLADHNRLNVQTSAGTCHARFDYRRDRSGIPQIGPLTCRKDPSR